MSNLMTTVGKADERPPIWACPAANTKPGGKQKKKPMGASGGGGKARKENLGFGVEGHRGGGIIFKKKKTTTEKKEKDSIINSRVKIKRNTSRWLVLQQRECNTGGEKGKTRGRGVRATNNIHWGKLHDQQTTGEKGGEKH